VFKSLRFEFQTKAGGSLLKLAVPVFGAMGAIEVVMAEEKLKSSIPEPLDFWGVKVYYHPVADRLSAGGNWSISAFYFHKAEAARSKRWIGFSYGA
jgi:hypothetical protein